MTDDSSGSDFDDDDDPDKIQVPGERLKNNSFSFFIPHPFAQ